MTAPHLRLRDVTFDDVAQSYGWQADPVANALAGFPARDEQAHHAHWAKILADPTVVARSIDVDGAVVGNVVSFEMKGEREVGYWIAREHWGHGFATLAVKLLLDEVEE